MKPNLKQINICNFCKSIINTWINTNDINSPTHFVDIEEFVHSEEFDETIDEELIENLGELLNTIKKYK